MTSTINWSKDRSYPKKAPERAANALHDDFDQNHSYALRYIQKSTGRLRAGMSILLADSEHVKNALVWISYHPSKEAKMGVYSYPICLSQNSWAFRQEFEKVFKATWIIAKKGAKYDAAVPANPHLPKVQ